MKHMTPAVVRAAVFLGLSFLFVIPGVAQGGPRSQHYFLTQGNGHIIQVYTGPTVQDVTAAANAPLTASSGSALTSYTQPGDLESVFYLASNQHVIQLYYSGSWKYFDLTAQTGGAPSISGGALTSFVDTAGQHAIYLGSNHHIYHLYYNPHSGYWVDQDLTSTTNGSLAASGSALTSFFDHLGESILYLATNQHVYQLYFNTNLGYWVDKDLTAAASGSLAASGSALTSFSDSSGETVVYLGTNQHAYQLYYNPSWGYWVDKDLTAISGGSAAVAGSGLTSFSDKADYYYGAGGEHVFHLSLEPNGADCYTGQPCWFVTELLYNGSVWTAQNIGLGYPPPLQGAFALTSLPGYDDGTGNGIDFEEVAFIETSSINCGYNLAIFEYIPSTWRGGGCTVGAGGGTQTSLTSFIDP